MRRLFALSIILVYFITGGCASGGGGVKQSYRERCMTVLSTVPSDAICVGYAAECGHSGMILDFSPLNKTFVFMMENMFVGFLSSFIIALPGVRKPPLGRTPNQ